MATWVAGKLSRPALRQALGYLQEKYPDNAITAQVARAVTSSAPLAPSEEAPLAQPTGATAAAAGIPPDEAEGAPASRSLRNRTQSAVQGRAQNWALGKAVSLLWQPIALPLTGFLWFLSLVLAFFEHRATAKAQTTKSQEQHERDVKKVASAIQNRPQGSHIALKPDSSHVSHVLRPHNQPRSVGPAAKLQSASSTSSAPSSATRPVHPVDLSKLTRLLSVDAQEHTCVVEAGCTFRDLVRATTTQRLVPVVVPPFPEQTVGGAFIGGAISSASGLAGSFASSVRSVEVVLASGEVVTASHDGPRSDLFHALAGSYHTLGTVVSLTVQLTGAPRYMHMSYENFNSLDQAMARMQAVLDKAKAGGLLGVEALVFSPTNITIAACRGLDRIDTGKHKVLSTRNWWDQHYVDTVRSASLQLQSRSAKKMPDNHCLPLHDYLWRYDNSSFWLGDFVYHTLPWPIKGNTFISRLLVGWALNDANLRSTLADDPNMQAKLGQLRVVQDVHVPLAHAARFMTWQLDAIGVAPLWLCPVLADRKNFLEAHFQHAAGGSSSSASLTYVNVGIYGRPHPHVPFNGEEVNEELIEQVYKAGGRSLLHAHNWHTPDLLRKMYDQDRYADMRAQCGAEEAYPSLFASSKVFLRDEDRAVMREAFKQPERPLLEKVAHRFIKHKITG